MNILHLFNGVKSKSKIFAPKFGKKENLWSAFCERKKRLLAQSDVHWLKISWILTFCINVAVNALDAVSFFRQSAKVHLTRRVNEWFVQKEIGAWEKKKNEWIKWRKVEYLNSTEIDAIEMYTLTLAKSSGCRFEMFYGKKRGKISKKSFFFLIRLTVHITINEWEKKRLVPPSLKWIASKNFFC